MFLTILLAVIGCQERSSPPYCEDPI